MKKLLTFTVLAFAMASVQAAYIDWSIGTGARTMRATDGTTALNGTAYLIFASDLAAIQNDIADGDSLKNIIDDYKIDDAAITNGKNTTKQTSDNDNRLVAGTEYTFQVLVYDPNADKYYASGVPAPKAAYDPNSTNEAQKIPSGPSFGYSDLYAVLATQTATAPYTDATGSSTPGIPEPATGALALAGVALLFKRRRA